MIRLSLGSALALFVFVFGARAAADDGNAPSSATRLAGDAGPEPPATAATEPSQPAAEATPPVAEPAPRTAEPAPRPTAEDGAPIGHAAPPTEAATHGAGPVRAGLEVFAQYSYRNLVGPGNNQTWFHAFDVPRAHAALEGELDGARGRVVLEATRSASEGSLLGVAGDSLVLRIREAYGAYRVVAPLELSAGVIPTLTVPNLDGTWMLRPVAPSALEASGLMSAADLGAKARVDLPRGFGWLAAAAYNGDGYTNRELNRGKTFEGAAEVHPLPNGALRPLGVFGSYVAGSTGTSLARADRVTGGLVWQGSRVRGGAYFTHAWGVAQLGTQRAMLASAFVRVEPVPRLLLGARADHTIRDSAVSPTDAFTTVLGSVGYRVALPVETFLALSRSIPTARAQSEVPGSNAWELRAIVRVVF
ncbi:MAG: hypothetical protein KF764_04975 [Labilithrix sp.]|nr:hypothetical protein [Labilithrix sp.]